MKWKTLLLAMLLVTVGACDSETAPPGSATGSKSLTDALADIENLPKYESSDWGYSVLDQKTGDVLAADNADHYFDPGSTMKTYSVATALRRSTHRSQPAGFPGPRGRASRT